MAYKDDEFDDYEDEFLEGFDGDFDEGDDFKNFSMNLDFTDEDLAEIEDLMDDEDFTSLSALEEYDVHDINGYDDDDYSFDDD